MFKNTSQKQLVTFWESPNYEKECLLLYHNLLAAKALNMTYESNKWSKDNARLDGVLNEMIKIISSHLKTNNDNLKNLIQQCHVNNCSSQPDGLMLDSIPYHPHWVICVEKIGNKYMKKHFETYVESVVQFMKPSLTMTMN